MGERRRLGVQDALWLEMDRPANLMVVDTVVWTVTPIGWDRLRAVVRHRLWDRYPAFRSVVVRGDDGAWYWEEPPVIDFEDHVSEVTLPKPGDDAALQDFIGSQRTVPLDREQAALASVLHRRLSGRQRDRHTHSPRHRRRDPAGPAGDEPLRRQPEGRGHRGARRALARRAGHGAGRPGRQIR